MKQLQKKKCVILNVVEDKRAFERIENGEQKVVFEYFDKKKAINKWYGKSESEDKWLVIKVWQDARKKGNKCLLFICDCIWDSVNWSWFGWLPDDKSYDEFDEPGDDHFVLYLGEQVELVK